MNYEKSLVAYNKYITNKLSSFQSQYGLGELSKSYQTIIMGAIPTGSQQLIYSLHDIYKLSSNASMTA